MTISTASQISSIQAELHAAVSGRCDFTDAGIALYTSDASNYRQVPLGVVVPASIDDIHTATKICRTHQVPVLMRGAGTSQNGQTVNKAIIIDCSEHLNRVLEIDAEKRTATVEPGVVCDALKAAALKENLTWGPDPATHSRCTLGGMIGNNSCGPHSMLAGKTVENVLELEVLTASGESFWVGPTSDDELEKIISGSDARAEIYQELKAIRDEYANQIRKKFPNIKRRVSGYNLDQLLPENGFNVARALVGSEGTCVTVLRARLKLIDNPTHVRLVVLGFKDIFTAGDCVPEIMPFNPIAMEGLDWEIVGGLVDRNLRSEEVALLPDGKAWLLVELTENSESALSALCKRFVQAMQETQRVQSVLEVTDTTQEKMFWAIREQGASATSMSLDPQDPHPVVGWEDTAVDPMQLGDYLREFKALVANYGYSTSLYGHFGDGCIHARITFDTRSSDGVKKFRAFGEDIARLVVRFGGSLSGEHGDGQAKAEFLPIMFGEELMHAFERFKTAWDPQLRMNPGKLINAYRVDDNLRFGPDYQPQTIGTTLTFQEDPGGFSHSTERCIGMGKCRATTGAMCPSYQATGEERYSTRGRAHLLHELVRGELISEGFADAHIADSLEHCLSCKACKTQCPTSVDIASYKAEFLEQHYRTVKRPLSHYPLAHIGTLLPLMSRFSGISNLLSKGLPGRLLKKGLNFYSRKSIPVLAKRSFTTSATARSHFRDENFVYFGERDWPFIVLWADSVNNNYRPHLLHSAISIVNKLGFTVAVARSHFCCGRPLYEYGYLVKAKSQLQNILDNFYTNLPVNSRVLVLEPSCLSVFKDELLRMFPDDKRANDLCTRTTTLTSWLSEQAFTLEPLEKGILHLHCHNKSSDYGAIERTWMSKCFNNLSEPEPGCCGMAGTYGMNNKTHLISERLYQRNIQAEISNSEADTITVTDGFSCAKAIRDNNKIEALHPVEVLDQCIRTTN